MVSGAELINLGTLKLTDLVEFEMSGLIQLCQKVVPVLESIVG